MTDRATRFRRDLAAAWIRRYAPGEPGGPLVVCLPHAGGAATFYRPLAEHIGGGVEVWAVQYPARQDRFHEPPVRTMDELARSVAAALMIAAEERRPVLFGHSMGSLLAFEVARLLERAGSGVRHLVASGRGAPSVPFLGDVATRDDATVVAELARMEGTDPVALENPELLELALPAIRADYAVIESWAPDPAARVTCPITVCVGNQDSLASGPDVARWQEHTSSGTVSVHTFPGGHFYLVEHVQAVATVVREAAA